MRQLLQRFDFTRELTEEDFLRDYSDSALGRFLLYLVVYRNQARDWDEKGHRLGFDGAQVLSDFQPQWHHIFPRKFLEGRYDDEQINALGNIAVIGPGINIRISAKDPMDYLDRYKVSDEKLSQQFVPIKRDTLALGAFPQFLADRSKVLTREANSYLAALGRGLVG